MSDDTTPEWLRRLMERDRAEDPAGRGPVC